jgi:hypothetical protein
MSGLFGWRVSQHEDGPGFTGGIRAAEQGGGGVTEETLIDREGQTIPANGLPASPVVQVIEPAAGWMGLAAEVSQLLARPPTPLPARLRREILAAHPGRHNLVGRLRRRARRHLTELRAAIRRDR